LSSSNYDKDNDENYLFMIDPCIFENNVQNASLPIDQSVHDSDTDSNFVFRIDPGILSDDVYPPVNNTVNNTIVVNSSTPIEHLFTIEPDVLTYDLITPGCTDNFTVDDCNFIFTIEPDVLTDEFVIPADSYNNLTVFNSLRNIRMKYAQNVIVSHINVNSLRKKFDEIKFILDNGY